MSEQDDAVHSAELEKYTCKRCRKLFVSPDRDGTCLCSDNPLTMARNIEKEQVRALGAVIGYGNMMHIASVSWGEKLAADGYPSGGEFVIGPCRALVVSCGCREGEVDGTGGCDWCCGCGWLTKHVREAQRAALKLGDKSP